MTWGGLPVYRGDPCAWRHIGDRGCKEAIAQIEQYAYLGGHLIGHHQVEPTVACRVNRFDVGDPRPDVKRHRWHEARRKKLRIDRTGKAARNGRCPEVNRKRAVASIADDEIGHACPVQIGGDDLGRKLSRGHGADPDEAAILPGVERDGVVLGIDARQQRALYRVGNPGDVPRWETGIDRDGRLEAAGLPGDAVAEKDVPGAIDDKDIVGAVAGDVGYQGRGMRSGGRLAGAGKGTATVVQQQRHC